MRTSYNRWQWAIILFIKGNNEGQYYWMGNDGGDKLFDIREWKYYIRIN